VLPDPRRHAPENPFHRARLPPEAYFEWGAAGALAIARSCAVVVVVDVLSFTTSVVMAASRGIEVFPCADDDAGRQLAGVAHAALGVGRHEQDESHPWSLSPASIAVAPSVDRLVLPSPNGSAISADIAATGTPVVAACLRNVTAVVSWLLDHDHATPRAPAGVIAAGERWSDGSLRPAIEDLFGAGLILSGLADAGKLLTPEAIVAARSVEGLPSGQLADLVRASTSGVELSAGGYGEDVELAVDADADTSVPVMAAGASSFRDGDVSPAGRR
jgi:2-phosphosulfolactate phosphatase